MQPLHVLRRDVRAHVWDYAVAAGMVVIAVVALITRIDVQDADLARFREDTWWGWAITIAICAALVGRRRWPLRTLAIGLALTLPLELSRHRDNITFFALVIGLFSVAAYLPIRLAWRGLAMTAVLYAVLIASGTTIITSAPLTGTLFLATAFALGLMLRRGRTQHELEVRSAIERAAAAVERADLQAADERLQMAQELHDVVAHSLSVIAVQAGIGVHLIDRQPAEAALALDAIRTTSHTAAGELTRLVDILRDGGSADGAPAPTLDGLSVLIDQIRSAGVPVTFTSTGDLHAVPAGVSLAAYRIVQEALTNVVRHAGAALATVTVRATDDQVELCIDDDGRGTTDTVDAARQGSGHGLIGMSERAQMYGGDVRSGPRPGGGFRLQATLRYFAGAVANETPTKPAGDTEGAGDASTTRPGSSLRQLPAWSWDIALAVAMACLATLEVVAFDAADSVAQFTPSDPWAWTLRIGCCLALAARRRYPTTSLAVSWVLGIALTVGDYQVGAIVFVLWIGLYTVGSHATTRRLIAAVVGSYCGMAIIAWSKPPDLSTSGAAWIGFFFVGAAVAGYAVRSDRERRTIELTEREGAADAASRRARLVIANERLRIADELSTIITRSIRTIADEAGEGSQIVDLDPGAARRALEAISAISRDALNDLRRLLKRIRTESEPAMYAPIASTGSSAVNPVDSVAAGESR